MIAFKRFAYKDIIKISVFSSFTVKYWQWLKLPSLTTKGNSGYKIIPFELYHSEYTAQKIVLYFFLFSIEQCKRGREITNNIVYISSIFFKENSSDIEVVTFISENFHLENQVRSFSNFLKNYINCL